jgi:hypothetical protein
MHDSQDDGWMDLEDLGPLRFQIPFSHAGGELESLQELQEEIMNLSGNRCVCLCSQSTTSNFFISRKDGRRRRDRVQRRVDYFNQQFPFITEAFLEWASLTSMERRPLSRDEIISPIDDAPAAVEPLNVTVIDIFCEYA